MSSSDDSIVPLWIDNKPVYTTKTFAVTSTAAETPVHDASSASPEDAVLAAASAQTAFKSWRTTPHTTRRDLIQRVASHYEAQTNTLVALQVRETSCTEAWARQNVTLAVSYLREIAAQVSSIAGIVPPTEKANTTGFVFKEPVGPVLCIAPWNAALILATRGIASAIAVGCAVVFKASELCPKTHFAITRAFVHCGVPPGVLNQIQCERADAAPVTEALIAHDAIRKVEFIGSAAVGRNIMQTAAKYLKPVVLELGGKCPAIVLDDADLQTAAMQCALGAVLNHGQVCFSTERVIVLESVAREFQEKLVDAMKEVQKAAGGAVSASIAQHARDVLDDAQAHGETVVYAAQESDTDGTVSTTALPPALVVNPSSNSRIFDEETFGPSASLYVVQTDEEAVALANRSAYGLNATVWTRDMARFLKMSRDLEYGQVHANSINVYTSPTGSQGGMKNSGFGRMNGKWGLEEFLVEKFVTWCG
ncbi:hypothetical protein ACJQWK_08700 [Exserohilum turcicum]|uniref:Aldehyde dehydrogenase domain-containing protein n=1 Tax=Exserohilum turcicum (strain 28A) TaxID=671987 RepID=R0ISB7_EXST2|nr:uncharacterized protein SETTUDRAFT_150540 [Exserohilum turcica Et28A]EOA87551.1 hypothetical protein SETTUDRAFT_150540 [Exserohilum turcica Et28A]